MTRKLAYGLVATAVVAVIAFLIWAYFETHKVRRGNFDRIRVGMTKDQVEDLLGGPANGTILAPKKATGYHRWYSGKSCGIMVYYDPAGEVDDMDFAEYQNKGWLAWLKATFGY